MNTRQQHQTHPVTREDHSALIVTKDRTIGRQLTGALREAGFSCVQTHALTRARKAIAESQPDVVIVGTGSPSDIGQLRIPALDSPPAVVILLPGPDFDAACEALRCGAADVLTPDDLDTAPERIRVAAQAGARARADAERQHRLHSLCRRLIESRRRANRQLSAMCRDAVRSHNAMADQLARVTLAAEFGSVIRDELELEPLLRNALEFILRRSGPTNGAIFLPSGGDYTLSAFVNQDLERDTADVLYDYLACTVAPAVELDEATTALVGPGEAATFLDGCPWLEHADMLMTPCHHDGECLAVLVLFRDTSHPYPTTLTRDLDTIAPAFARQLARAVHVHHRHLPREKWGLLGDEDQDSDLAA